jgi:hypothetical protein
VSRGQNNVATKDDPRALEQPLELRFGQLEVRFKQVERRIDQMVTRLGALVVILLGLLFAALH